MNSEEPNYDNIPPPVRTKAKEVPTKAKPTTISQPVKQEKQEKTIISPLTYKPVTLDSAHARSLLKKGIIDETGKIIMTKEEIKFLISNLEAKRTIAKGNPLDVCKLMFKQANILQLRDIKKLLFKEMLGRKEEIDVLEQDFKDIRLELEQMEEAEEDERVVF